MKPKPACEKDCLSKQTAAGGRSEFFVEDVMCDPLQFGHLVRHLPRPAWATSAYSTLQR